MPSKKSKASSTKSKNKKPAKVAKPAPKKAPVKKAAPKKGSKPVLKNAGKSGSAKKAPSKAIKPVKSASKKAAPAKKKATAKTAPVKKTLTSKKVQVKKPAASAKKTITKSVPKKLSKKVNPVSKAVAKPVAKVAKPAVKPVTKPAAGKPVAAQKVSKPASKPADVVKKPAPVASKPLTKAEPTPAKIQESVFKKPEKQVQDVLAISNTMPVREREELSPSRIASISNSITNPIRKTDSYAVKPEKEPHGKYELEFVVHASAEMLYEFLSTPSGLSEWFCDDLNIRNGIYTFIWDDQLQQARLLKTVDLQVVRFQWVDKTDGSYFEFRIQRDDLTNDISLIITDFADTVSERESSKLLWNSQVEKLMHVIGSIF